MRLKFDLHLRFLALQFQHTNYQQWNIWIRFNPNPRPFIPRLFPWNIWGRGNQRKYVKILYISTLQIFNWMCPFFPGQLKLPVTTGLNIRRAKDKNEGGKKAQKNRSKNYFKKEGSIRKKKKEGGERAKSKNSKVFGKIVILKQKFLNKLSKK